MFIEILIISVLLLLVNGFLVYAIRQDKKSTSAQIANLKQGYIERNESFDEEELEDEVEPEQKYIWAKGILVCLDIWILGAIATHIWAHYFFNGINEGDNAKALFGDSFGAVNALISAFAFAGMIVAFVLQKYELKLQRKELKAQRKEFEQQNKTLALQRFENTFFNMMELQQKIVSDLSIKDYDKIWTREEGDNGMKTHEELVDVSCSGRQFISYIFRHYVFDSKSGNRVAIGLSSSLTKGGIAAYDESSYRSLLDHYFRHLYTILKFINGSDDIPSFADKYKYASFLRATLSRYELVLLYYNGLSSVGNQKLKPLLERYCMLKNLDADLLVLSYDSFEMTGVATPNEAYEFLTQNGFSGGDYELLLTEKENDPQRYHIKAFYNTAEGFEKAKSIIKRVEELFK